MFNLKHLSALAGAATIHYNWGRRRNHDKTSLMRSLPRSHQHPVETMQGAVVIGAETSTGQHVLQELLASGRCDKVTAVVHSQCDFHDKFWAQDQSRLQVAVVPGPSDRDSRGTVRELEALCRGHDTVFICTRSTCKETGSLAAFKNAEVGFTALAAKAARLAKVEHALVLSGQHANAHSKRPSAQTHVRTLGEKEKAVLNMKFPRVSIFRPGTLAQKKGSFPQEKLFAALGMGLQIDDLARCMVRAAESTPVGVTAIDSIPAVYDGSEIIAFCGGSTQEAY